MTQHSAGPWEVIDGHYPSFREIKGPSFRISIVVSAPELSFADFMQREADARLIAAAPDLLAALESIFEIVNENECGRNASSRIYECGTYARAAIAKATGSAA